MASNTAGSGAGRWQCQKCRTSNSAGFNTCKCGVRRGDNDHVYWQDLIYPTKKYPNGDWDCPLCGTLQFARRPTCRWTNCNGKRPGVYFTSSAPPTQAAHEPAPNVDSRHPASTHLKGDWDCSSCGSHQFARRTTCRDCGAEKPQSGSSESSAQSAPDKECVVCMDRTANTMLYHDAANSGHTCVCWECAETLRKNDLCCPMCREPIDKLIKSF